MKNLISRSIVSVVIGLCALVSFSGCQTAGNFSPIVQALGPGVSQIASERISLSILKGHPGRESVLTNVSNDLGLLTDGTNLAEITDNAIRAFVSTNAQKWGLLAGEEKLLTDGLLATRAQFLASTGKTSVFLSDPNVTVYISAIRQGISDGIAENARRATNASK